MQRMLQKVGSQVLSKWTSQHNRICTQCLLPASSKPSWDRGRRGGRSIQPRIRREGRHVFYSVNVNTTKPSYVDAVNDEVAELLAQDVTVVEDFLSEEEERALIEEVEPHLKRMRYQKDHWDNAIQSYREIEHLKWREVNKPVIDRIRTTAFPEGEPQIAFVHILDLAADGHIKPHVDSIRFCGSTIAGISLLSPSIMRFVHENDSDKYGDVLLKQRSLYIMRGTVRYEYTHEILKSEKSIFKGEAVPKDRRISIICRTEADPTRVTDVS